MSFQCKYSIKTIIQALEENKTKHIKDYKKAIGIYKQEAEKHLNHMLRSIQNGKRINHNICLMAPVNYAKEYDRMIGMFEKSLDKTIILTEEQYNSIFCDKWHWMNSFNSNTMVYLRGVQGIPGSTGIQGCAGIRGFSGSIDEEARDIQEGEDLIPEDLK